MPQPRSCQISLSDTPYYHCMARCVHRSFLCIYKYTHHILLEAKLRPVEQLDKRPPGMAEGRITQEQLSRRRDWVPIIREVLVTNLKCIME